MTDFFHGPLHGRYSGKETLVPIDLLPPDILELYEVHEWKHACAVLQGDFPDQFNDIVEVLREFRLLKSHVLAPGGRKSKVAEALDQPFDNRGWKEKSWDTKIVVDDTEMESPTHKVDCYKNGVAIEIEWSNKDPFFDRDLNNFRLLFELRAISVGVIITKCDEYKPIFKNLGVYTKYGASTTWVSKLLPRIEGGGGGGCPILVFGITPRLFQED